VQPSAGIGGVGQGVGTTPPGSGGIELAAAAAQEP
jgi:hypothetical protein